MEIICSECNSVGNNDSKMTPVAEIKVKCPEYPIQFNKEAILELPVSCENCGSDLLGTNSTLLNIELEDLTGFLLQYTPIIASLLMWVSVNQLDFLQRAIYSSFIGVSTLILTSVLSVLEMNKLRVEIASTKEPESGLMRIFLQFILLWWISYPYYLYQRSQREKVKIFSAGFIITLIFTLSWLTTIFSFKIFSFI